MSQYESLEIYIKHIIWGQFENEFDFFRKSYRILSYPLPIYMYNILYDNIILGGYCFNIQYLRASTKSTRMSRGVF